MDDALARACWPRARLAEALVALAGRAGLATRAVELPPARLAPARDGAADAALGAWFDAAAHYLGLEAEAVETTGAELEPLVAHAAPAVLLVPGAVGPDGEPGVLLLAGPARGGRVPVLAPDLRTRRVALARVCTAVRAPAVAAAATAGGVDALVARLALAPGRAARVRDALLRERVAGARVAGCWLLRAAPDAPARGLAAGRRFGARVALAAGVYLAQYALALLAWAMVGRGALQGRLDRGWLWAWALLMVTVVPLRLLMTWTTGNLAIDAAALLKQRLLAGALRLLPDEVREQGPGRLLGRVIESEAVESLALGGGIVALAALLDLGLSAIVMAAGAAPALHLALLAAWTALVCALGARCYRRSEAWTDQRLAVTDALVEHMVGHRTRLAQEPRERWHVTEDAAHERYVAHSQRVDRAWRGLLAAAPRGWLLVGLAALAPAFVGGASTVALAISLGGVLLGVRALRALTAGLASLVGAAVAWRKVRALFHAAARPVVRPPPRTGVALAPQPAAVTRGDGRAEGGATADDEGDATATTPSPPRPVVLEASRVVVRQPGRAAPVLRGASVVLRRGDRVLLEGPSGSGKSTLGAVLTALHAPESGLVLLDHLDLQTLGPEQWRRRVAAAPQFHENHVLTGALAFNLLMGRAWPPGAADLREAEAVCRELGLGPLLDRMPAGLLQMVGETGWQLSHGERSRLFIARALLQRAEVVLLDESFAALDPATLAAAMDCVLRRAETLVVIAHP